MSLGRWTHDRSNLKFTGTGSSSALLRLLPTLGSLGSRLPCAEFSYISPEASSRAPLPAPLLDRLPQRDKRRRARDVLRRPAAHVNRPNARPAAHELAENGRVPHPRRSEQRRLAVLVARVDAGARVGERDEHVDVAAGARRPQRSLSTIGRSVDVCATRNQQLDDVRVPFYSCTNERRFAAVAAAIVPPRLRARIDWRARVAEGARRVQEAAASRLVKGRVASVAVFVREAGPARQERRDHAAVAERR